MSVIMWCVHCLYRVNGTRGKCAPMEKSLAVDWADYLNRRWPMIWHYIKAEPITYKGGRIWLTRSTHPDYCYEVYWRNATRSQRCGSVEQAKKILDMADFFNGAIHEVQL